MWIKIRASWTSNLWWRAKSRWKRSSESQKKHFVFKGLLPSLWPSETLLHFSVKAHRMASPAHSPECKCNIFQPEVAFKIKGCSYVINAKDYSLKWKTNILLKKSKHTRNWLICIHSLFLQVSVPCIKPAFCPSQLVLASSQLTLCLGKCPSVFIEERTGW